MITERTNRTTSIQLYVIKVYFLTDNWPLKKYKDNGGKTDYDSKYLLVKYMVYINNEESGSNL